MSGIEEPLGNMTDALLNGTLQACGVVEGEAGELLSGGWYIGVALSIAASICSNMGMNVQKFSMIKEGKASRVDREYEERAYIFQPYWVIGLGMVIFGALGDFIALGFAAQSLTTPVGGLTMVANIMFAHMWLGEALSRMDIVATCIILCGVVTVAISADKTEKFYTLQCLLDAYLETEFLVYAFFMGMLLLFGYGINVYLRKLRARAGARFDSKEYKKWKKIHPVCPAALSGLVGAQSVLFAKSTAELIKVSLEGDNQFLNGATYVIMLLMFVSIFSQIHWLAMALKDFDAVIVVPVFQCFFITGSIIGGGVLFKEFENLATWELALFMVGITLTQVGVFLLAQREQAYYEELEGHPSPGAVHPEINKRARDGSTSMDSEGTNSARSSHHMSSSRKRSSNRISSSRKASSSRMSSGRSGRRSKNGTTPRAANGTLDQMENGLIPAGAERGDSDGYCTSDSEDERNATHRPPTPMPMSLQFSALAVNDLYHAIVDGLSHTERFRRHSHTHDHDRQPQRHSHSHHRHSRRHNGSNVSEESMHESLNPLDHRRQSDPFGIAMPDGSNNMPLGNVPEDNILKAESNSSKHSTKSASAAGIGEHGRSFMRRSFERLTRKKSANKNSAKSADDVEVVDKEDVGEVDEDAESEDAVEDSSSAGTKDASDKTGSKSGHPSVK